MLAQRDDRVEAEINDLVRREERDWMVTVSNGVATFEGLQNEVDRRAASVLAGTVRGVTGIRFEPGPSPRM